MSEPLATSATLAPAGTAGTAAASVGTGGTAAGGTLKGRMGTTELVLAVLAYAAPLATVSGVIPFVIGLNGPGAPGIYVAATLCLLAFAAGLAAMSRQLPNPGAFYAYVTAGLGRPIGLGAAFLALWSYTVIGVASFAFLGSATSRLFTDTLGLPAVPWYVWQWVGIALCALIGWFNVELSAKVLSIVMVLEVLVVIVFDVAVGVQGGEAGFDLAPWTPDAFNGGSVGAALVFAALCFLGFESTAVYREETRDPERTIPRAMYLSVGLIGLFYAVTAYLMVTAYGSANAGERAASDPGTFFSAAIESHVGSVMVDIAALMLVTSVFASMVAGQNMLARYAYSLGRDGVLPRALGSSHPRHNSPNVAALVVAGIVFLGTLPFAFSTEDPMVFYGHAAGVGSYSIVCLMLLASIAVFVYFRRHPGTGTSVWTSTIFPGIGLAALAAGCYLATRKFDLISGLTGSFAVLMMAMTALVVLAGVALALWLRRRDPEVYARIGRQRI